MEETYLLNVEGVKKKILHGGQGELPKLQDGSKVSHLGCFPKALGEWRGLMAPPWPVTIRFPACELSSRPVVWRDSISRRSFVRCGGGKCKNGYFGHRQPHCPPSDSQRVPLPSPCIGALVICLLPFALRSSELSSQVVGNLPFLMCQTGVRGCQWGASEAPPPSLWEREDQRGFCQVLVHAVGALCELGYNGKPKESSQI